MAAIWSEYALNTFIAPEFSAFTRADIPDRSALAKACQPWLSKFVLQTMVQINFGEARGLLHLFTRRAQSACLSYEAARQATATFLSKRDPSSPAASAYSTAMSSWEAFLSDAWLSASAWSHGWDKAGELFQKNDGSAFQRLNTIHNVCKHAERWMARGDVPPEATFAVWMTNDGLKCTESQLSWSDCASILDELAKAVAALDALISKQTEKK